MRSLAVTCLKGLIFKNHMFVETEPFVKAETAEAETAQKPVLTIFYQFSPWQSSLGGIQSIIRSFIKYAPSDFEVRLVGVGSGDESMPPGQWHKTEYAGRTLWFLPLFDLPEDNVRQLIPTSVRYTLALLKRDLSSDFMHFHRMEPALASFRWAGRKLLYIHNDMHQKVKTSSQHRSFLWQRFPWLYFAMERALLQQFETVLVCNADTTQFYHSLYPKFSSRISHVRNAVDDEVFYPLSEQAIDNDRRALANELNLADSTQFFLFAGRLHPQKDPLLLIRSIAALNGLKGRDSEVCSSPNVHLLIAGAGELQEAVKAEIERLNLQAQVTLLGTFEQQQLVRFYRVATAFVLTSLYEGLPVVALESLSCGTPVITTRAGDTPSVLTPASGIVCEQRQPASVAQAMAAILSHPERYPAHACVQAAQPYRGKSVIRAIYDDMRSQWTKQRKRLQATA